jgi:uncharacterized repeat protein (TIGR03803 family)
MNVTGGCSVFQRSHRPDENAIRRSPRPSVLRRACLLASAAFGMVLAGGTSAGASPTLTTLVTFTNPSTTNGAGPIGALIADGNGNLYGTTKSGGQRGSGTIFEVSVGTRTLSSLLSFNDLNGSAPVAGMIADPFGNYYGTTSSGGGPTGGYAGTVFQLAAGTHALSTLAIFDNYYNTGGDLEAGVIVDAVGNLYGTTYGGGNGGGNGYGTVFQVAASTHAISTLATFNNNNGANPKAGLIADADGNLYGTTRAGGANGYGTVFEVAAGTHALSTLATFNSSSAFPEADMIADAAGNLYGTTSGVGAISYGTVFEIAAGTHAYSTLATFSSSNANPKAALTIDAAGNLFGTTEFGGPNGYGTVFELAAGTHVISTLAIFDYNTTGGFPQGPLVADAAGNLYGTTGGGGNGGNGFGTVFELTDTGFVSAVPEPSAASLVGLPAWACSRAGDAPKSSPHNVMRRPIGLYHNLA